MKIGALAFFCLWIAATLEFGLPNYIRIFGGHPDFILITMLVFSPWMTRGWATVFGFLGGVWTGAMIGANLAHYAISRTLAGFLAGWTRSLKLEMSPVVMGILVAIGTIGTNLIFMFTAAPKALGPFLLDTIVGAVYNGVLAMPLYALLRWILGDPNRRGS